MPPDPTAGLPRPFYNQWAWSRRPAAHALWEWHAGLADPHPEEGHGPETRPDGFFDAERARAEQGKAMRLLSESVAEAAYEACAEYGLNRDFLGAQVEAARWLCGETRFETTAALKDFSGLWAVSHARLLAGLAGIDMSVHLRYVDELARGFFHLARLLRLPTDVREGRLFIPMDTLQQRDVTVEQLREGRVDEDLQGLLWKESVRVRDALAQGRPLISALSLRHRFALKRFWIGALELLNDLERREYDLWGDPPRLSAFRRVQVYLQTLLGRSVSR